MQWDGETALSKDPILFDTTTVFCLISFELIHWRCSQHPGAASAKAFSAHSLACRNVEGSIATWVGFGFVVLAGVSGEPFVSKPE